MQLLRDAAIELQPDVVIFNGALSACGRASRWRTVLQLLEDMAAQGMLPSVVSYGTAISACGGAWQIALHLLQEVQISGLEVNVFVCSSAITACGWEWQQSLAIFTQMKSLAVVPNFVTFGAAITACEHGQQWTQALELLQLMESSNLKLNTQTCCAAMSACGKADCWEMALALLGDMPAHKLEMDSYACSTAVWACGHRPSFRGWQQALSVFFELYGLAVEPNEVAIGSAIAACEAAGRWEVALQLLFSESCREVGLDVACVNCAIGALQTGSQWQLALCLFAACNGSLPDAQPNDLTYSAVMRACRRAYHWDKALWVWSSNETTNTPTMLTWSEAVSAAECGGKWELALFLVGHGAASGLKLDSILCTAAASACQKAYRWQEPLHMLHLIQTCGLEMNLIACTAAAASCGSMSCRWARVFQLLAWMDWLVQRDAALQSVVVSVCEDAGLEHRLGPLLDQTADLTESLLIHFHQRH